MQNYPPGKQLTFLQISSKIIAFLSKLGLDKELVKLVIENVEKGGEKNDFVDVSNANTKFQSKNQSCDSMNMLPDEEGQSNMLINAIGMPMKGLRVLSIDAVRCIRINIAFVRQTIYPMLSLNTHSVLDSAGQ